MQPVLIAGPCVIETEELLDTVARELVRINQKLGTDIIFKASFDKANRTSISSFRGPGLERGLQMLADVKAKHHLRVLTDIHESWQAAPVSEVCDVLQIPAFLCRQTDLLVAAAKTGRIVNIKKAQFLSGQDMRYPVEKARDAGAKEVWLTERGNSFGYNNLVVDFRNIPDMLEIVPTVIMDCTHSVQRPGGGGGKTSGDRRFVPSMALAAKAFGATGFFFEAFKILPSDTPIFGFQRVPFISRTIEYGYKAELKGYKESLSVAIEQAENKEVIHKQLENIFEKPINLLDSFYEVSLSNSNPLLHPSRTYTMWKDWKPGVVYPRNPQFYAEWTIEASSLLIKMDEEFQNLLKALGLKPGCIPTVLDYYESTDAESLTLKLQSIKAFQGIQSPMKEVSGGFIPDFTSRYFTEDFPYGMRFIIETAQKHNFPIPTIENVYQWGASIIS